MRLACLFWFYKSPEVCENRLRILRKYNPDVRVFGLYGGDLDATCEFQQRLEPYLDDFYCFPDARPHDWKWRHGDRMIARWFSERGRALEWDTVFIMQWDMLVFDRIEHQFPNLQRGEVLISGLRPVSEVFPWWSHVRPDSPDRAEYDRFLNLIREKYNYDDEPLCGLFIVVCLPREFLIRYAEIPEPELGFLEYKVPIYAQIFGTPFCRDHRHRPWWDDHPHAKSQSLFARALNAGRQNVPLRVIAAHRAFPWGRRIFHPVFDSYPIGFGAQLMPLSRDIYEHELKRRWWRLNQRLFGKR